MTAGLFALQLNPAVRNALTASTRCSADFAKREGLTLRHSLFKYYDQRIWAEKFLEGEVLFRSLAYFRDCEDTARGDEYEGTSRFLPDGGLQITSQTKGTQFTLDEYAFESAVNANEIFVFCTSRRFGEDLAKEFNTVVAVEIRRMPTFCDRIQAALPPTAAFRARRVDYYEQSQSGNPRWALPDNIAASKLKKWAYQQETRFIFSLTDALNFENVKCQLVYRKTRTPPMPEEHLCHLLKIGSLRDICALREC